MTLAASYERGARGALHKLGLGPPTQVDQLVADIESGKDIPPQPPPMAPPPALDGTTPLSMPAQPSPAPGLGSTVGRPPEVV